MNITTAISMACVLLASCFVGATDKYTTKHHTNWAQIEKNQRRAEKAQLQAILNREKKAAKRNQLAEIQEQKEANKVDRKHAATVKALVSKTNKFS